MSFRFIAIGIAFLIVTGAGSNPAFAMRIDKVLLFADADSVRIETTLAPGAALPAATLTGRITPFPEGEPLR